MLNEDGSCYVLNCGIGVLLAAGLFSAFKTSLQSFKKCRELKRKFGTQGFTCLLPMSENFEFLDNHRAISSRSLPE